MVRLKIGYPAHNISETRNHFMDLKLQNKTALVTAGANGIGLATVKLLNEEGVKVIVADVDAEQLEAIGNEANHTICADLSSPIDVVRVVEETRIFLGASPDLIVNNVGVADQEPFSTLSDDQWAKSHELNLMSTVRICREFLPEMRDRPGCAVVNVSSDLAKQPEPMPMEYGVAKAGILYLTKALAKEFAPNVRVNAVCPGPIWTRLWSRPGGIVDQLSQEYGLDRDAALEKYLADRYMPLGMGEADDVAQSIAFLLSPATKRITGATIDIGGTIRGLL